MAKEHWRTWTLFIQNWKYFWAKKYDVCIKCWTCNFKHAWKWLCTSCYDRIRSNKPERSKELKDYKRKRYLENRNPVENDWRKNNWWKILSDEERRLWKIKASTKRQKKHREIIDIKARTKRRLKSWKPCMSIRINWELIYLPFERIDTRWITSKNEKEMLMMKEYYENITK